MQWRADRPLTIRAAAGCCLSIFTLDGELQHRRREICSGAGWRSMKVYSVTELCEIAQAVWWQPSQALYISRRGAGPHSEGSQHHLLASIPCQCSRLRAIRNTFGPVIRICVFAAGENADFDPHAPPPDIKLLPWPRALGHLVVIKHADERAWARSIPTRAKVALPGGLPSHFVD
jgi:hypothetical protein